MDWFEDIRKATKELMKEFDEMFKEDLTDEQENIMQEAPLVYGFSYFIGPNGAPVFKEFSNIVRPRTNKPSREGRFEPYSDTIVDEEKGTVTVTLEIPGVDKQDVSVKIEGNSIVIKGVTKGREFEKKVPLTSDVDKDTIKATYKNGILEITAKITKDKSESREIRVD